jgi:hypothetical protein
VSMSSVEVRRMPTCEQTELGGDCQRQETSTLGYAMDIHLLLGTLKETCLLYRRRFWTSMSVIAVEVNGGACDGGEQTNGAERLRGGSSR